MCQTCTISRRNTSGTTVRPFSVETLHKLWNINKKEIENQQNKANLRVYGRLSKPKCEMTVENDKYILLADDDMEDQEILKEAILSVHPEMTIQSVWNGQEALNYLAGCLSGDLPSLIVLDYKMPVLNAVDVLNQIGDHPLYKSIPKVVWSTS